MIKDNYIYWENHIVYYILEILLMQMSSQKMLLTYFSKCGTIRDIHINNGDKNNDK